jgi:hypothetical protein
MNEKYERLKAWTNNLSEDQLRAGLLEAVAYMVASEELNFWDDSLAPYWECTGEPFIEGQKCFKDDDSL